MLILTAADLKRALPMPAAVAAVEEAFRLGEEDFQIPARSTLPLKGSDAVYLMMPAHAPRAEALGTKLVGVFPSNPKAGFDLVQAFYLLFSATDGRPLALMDGKYLTAIRTAATSAVATRIMARRGASRLGIFGTGTQAQFHLRAIPEVRPITQALVCGLNPDDSEQFARMMADEFPFPIDPASREETARRADVICTCTTSSCPVLAGKDLVPGTHINAIGAYQPHTRELDDDAVRQAWIVVDTMEGVMAEAGDVLIPLQNGALRKDQIAGTLSQVVRGEAPGRRLDRDITVFKSVGFALEDLAAGFRAYEAARSSGLGTLVSGL